MMAETRKTWKAERKQLLAQVEQLSSAPVAAPVARATEAAPRPLKTTKSLVAASQMLPPSSPVYAKQKSRMPMQGASELGPPSETMTVRHLASPPPSPRRRSYPSPRSPPRPLPPSLLHRRSRRHLSSRNRPGATRWASPTLPPGPPTRAPVANPSLSNPKLLPPSDQSPRGPGQGDKIFHADRLL